MTDPVVTDGLTRLRGIEHGFFGRRGGVSTGLYAALNCGFGSDDDRGAVAENRGRVARALGRDGGDLVTVHQVHGTVVARVDRPWQPDQAPRADGLVTCEPGIVLGILTADCAPVLLADPVGRVVGAAHAGWKGALAGVVEATVAAMEREGADRTRIVAAIGPCIGPQSYEVGLEFVARFTEADPANGRFFRAGQAADKRLFDLPGYLLARLRLIGLADIQAVGLDTLADGDRWFSYRRSCLEGEADYGRQLSAITLT